jgi:hypothetical protein
MTRPTPAAIRPWCAKAQYPGLLTFRVGTVHLPRDAQHHEIIAALDKHARTFLPAGFDIIEPLCGALFFAPEANE